MNHKQIVVAWLTVFSAIIALQISFFQPAFAQSMPARQAGTKDVRILVGAFLRPLGQYAPPNWQEWQQRLQEALAEQLHDNNVNVVERERMQEMKDELLRVGDTVAPEQARHIGQMAGATHLLAGRTAFEVHTLFGGVQEYVFILKARLVSLQSGEIVKNYDETKEKKQGSYLRRQNEDETAHFLGSTLEAACTKLAKKVADNPPPAEDASAFTSGTGQNGQNEMSGTRAVEGDGQATVQQGDEQAARTAARDAAVREAVLRMGRMFTRSDSQQATQTLIETDPSRYAVVEGNPLSESIREGVCHTTVRVRIFLTNAPENKLALIARLRDRGLLYMPTVMVIVPETHIARPRIPDPALETEIARQVSDAGFQVVDTGQVARIRDEDWVRALSTQSVTQDELSRLKTNYGADIVVTGEGISERAESDHAGSGTVRCAARGEIKAFRVDNGEMIFSDAVPDEQATGIAEAIVAKNALQNAGKRIAPRIVDALFQRGFGRITTTPDGKTDQVAGTLIDLKISGWERASDVGAFLEALPKVKGIIKVSASALEASVLNVKLLVQQEVTATFGYKLADDPAVQAFHLVITTFHGTTLDGKVNPLSHQ